MSSFDWDEEAKKISKPGKSLEKWADESMFVAEKATALTPKVTLIHANNDPLGQLAQLAQMYQGKSHRGLEFIADKDREYYVTDMEKNILGMPSETVGFHFLIENVTRSYTHQLVRTRHASYAQESLRFAVKEDFPVGLPPSLHGTDPRAVEKAADEARDMHIPISDWVEKNVSQADRMRYKWDVGVSMIKQHYLELINEGMPAEDARGLLPHNILTKVNMFISLRSLMSMAGQRLCTQAQFEHRTVWNEIIHAIREYGKTVTYRTVDANIHHGAVYEETGDKDGNLAYEVSSAWQFEFLASRFMPICYQTGHCQFESDFDRYCNIRDRVQANAKIGRPSKEWDKPHTRNLFDENSSTNLGIPAIRPTEWLSPDAAIQKDAHWRSEEALQNIRDRRL